MCMCMCMCASLPVFVASLDARVCLVCLFSVMLLGLAEQAVLVMCLCLCVCVCVCVLIPPGMFPYAPSYSRLSAPPQPMVQWGDRLWVQTSRPTLATG